MRDFSKVNGPLSAPFKPPRPPLSFPSRPNLIAPPGCPPLLAGVPLDHGPVLRFRRWEALVRVRGSFLPLRRAHTHLTDPPSCFCAAEAASSCTSRVRRSTPHLQPHPHTTPGRTARRQGHLHLPRTEPYHVVVFPRLGPLHIDRSVQGRAVVAVVLFSGEMRRHLLDTHGEPLDLLLAVKIRT